MKQSATRWILPPEVSIPAEMDSFLSGDHLLGEALVRRGILTTEQARSFLDPDLYQPCDSSQLPDLDKAVFRIQKALDNRERIGIWGDFDVDGQTSTTLFVSALQQLNGNVQYHIPVRASESHGINLPNLKTFLDLGIDLLISCDTGITAFDAAQACLDRSVDFIISDHHILADALPAAYAVVNPQRLPPGHALSYLCGVGCVFKIIEKLYQNNHRMEALDQFLDLATLGTIADIALLKGDNRYLVQKGLKQLQSDPRPAIKAILTLSEINQSQISEEQISFLLAPRMNALGRLSDANPIVPFLTSQNPQMVQDFALQLEKWNNERKMLCDQIFKAAQSLIENNRSLLDDPVLVLAHPDWPTGVVGIVASRLVDLYHRPAILLANPPGQPARGSARSVEGLNITAAIAAQKELLLGFGGHAMAAGMAIEADNIPKFRRSISRYIHQVSQNVDLSATVSIDSYLPLQDISLSLVERISSLAPFGAGNPALVLAARNVFIKEVNDIGKTRDHRKMVVEDASGTMAEVLWWQGAGSPLPADRFDMAYSVHANDFKGSSRVQVEWIDAREIENETIVIDKPRLKIQSIDLRAATITPQKIKEFKDENWLVWAEGHFSQEIPGLDRFHLSPHPQLILWNPPPGIVELKQVLEIVSPEKIIFLSNATTPDDPTQFLKELSGLVRFSLKEKGGKLDLALLAARLGHRQATILTGIEWLCAKGFIKISERESPACLLISEPGAPQPLLQKFEFDLRLALNETLAYRQYYLRTPPEQIISSAQHFLPK